MCEQTLSVSKTSKTYTDYFFYKTAEFGDAVSVSLMIAIVCAFHEVVERPRNAVERLDGTFRCKLLRTGMLCVSGCMTHFTNTCEIYTRETLRGQCGQRERHERKERRGHRERVASDLQSAKKEVIPKDDLFLIW